MKRKNGIIGERVRVEDIDFTIETIKNSDSIYSENVEKIQNIEKINDITLKIHLSEPVNFFEYLLCFPIVQKETYNQEIPGGTGKYTIDKLNEEEIIIKNDNKTITIKIYNTVAELYNNFTRENVDLIITKNSNYEEYIGNIGFEETIITGREFYYIYCENIENVNTRKIIDSSISKEKLVYDLFNKRYKVAEFPLDYGSYLNKENEQELAIKNSKKMHLTLSMESYDGNKEIAQIIKYQLKEENIDITIQYYNNTNSDMILKKQIVPITPEISIYFRDEQTKQDVIKISNIEDKEVLKKEYEKIIEKYYEEMPFISLYFNSYIVLHNSKLKGDFSGNWYNFFYNIDNWYKVV